MQHKKDPFSTSIPLTSRQFQSETDLHQMFDLLMQARRRTNDWRYWHVGELAFNYFMLTCHLDPHEHIRLWYDMTGKLAGFAILGEDPSFDWQILPEYEWGGLEQAALSWVESRLKEKRDSGVQEWRGSLVAWARQDDRQRIDFLKGNGFRYRGEFAEVNMLHSLSEPIAKPALPAGYLVRSFAGAQELAGRAAAQREVWQPWTVGNISDDDYARFMRLPCYLKELDVVTVSPEGRIVAYINGWIDPLNKIGDFGPVGALPAFRRLGLTRAALLDGLGRMKALGMERVCISTGDENYIARNLYESVGFRSVNKYLDYIK